MLVSLAGLASDKQVFSGAKIAQRQLVILRKS